MFAKGCLRADAVNALVPHMSARLVLTIDTRPQRLIASACNQISLANLRSTDELIVCYSCGRMKSRACTIGQPAQARSVAVEGQPGGDMISYILRTKIRVLVMHPIRWPWSLASSLTARTSALDVPRFHERRFTREDVAVNIYRGVVGLLGPREVPKEAHSIEMCPSI